MRKGKGAAAIRVNNISLKGFRSYQNAAFSFQEGVNIVCGPNAAGKTNLLEGVFLLSGMPSWRSRKKADLIAFGESRASIEASIASRERDFKLDIDLPRAGRSGFSANSVRLKRQYELSEYFRCVLFSPEELLLVKGGAAERRRFLDTALCQLRPRYAYAASKYSALLEQKLAVLKGQDRGLQAVLPEINQQLVEYGAFILKVRAGFIAQLQREGALLHSAISGGKEQLEIVYRTVSNISDPLAQGEEIGERLREHMEAHYNAELESRSCLSGVHKDDMDIFINGQPARGFSSQGQARTAALALKFGERELFRQDSGEYPVLLLDDVLSELDGDRQSFVTSRLQGGQTIITCCVPPELNGACMIKIGE